MFRFRQFSLLLIPSLLASGLPGQVTVPAPIHEYVFAGNLTDSYGGPALQALGGTVSGGAYVFGANQGLLLIDPALSVSTYTFEFQFKFDTIGGYQRILEFKNRGADTGLYSLGSSLNFYNVASASQADFAAGQTINVVLTRDGLTSQVSGYVNGQARFSFTDTNSLGVFSGPNLEAYFFTDDLAVGGEAAAGSVNLLRYFNQSMTSAQVLELFQNGPPAAVPEPSTLVLLGLGLCALLVRRYLST